jgi:hypothetical protein
MFSFLNKILSFQLIVNYLCFDLIRIFNYIDLKGNLKLFNDNDETTS